MGTLFLEFRGYILDRLLDLLWRQWSALGVPGRTTIEERRVVDPESLLLISLTVGRYDARLFDEILDWLVVNGAFLNVQRLRNLMKRFGFESQAQLSSVSELLMKKSNDPLKWKRLATPRSPRNPEPLFFLKSGKPIPTPDEKAPEFSPYGLLRGPIKLRGHAQPFPTKGMPSLLLRLRALLGVNARCELFCLLAAAEEIHPSDVARQTGYSPRTMQNTLAEMARSGVVQMRSGNRDKWYSLNSGVLDYLLKPEGSTTPWINWAPLFRALEMLWIRVIDPKWQNLDPLTLASELRRLGKEIRPLLADAGWGRQLEDDSSFRGVEYSAVFIRNIEGILDQLNQ
ncbi:MAG TPA: helix-turn-helix transcriptional regulator [Anaerolineales bacterium]